MQSNDVYMDLKDKDIGLGWPEPALREGNCCDMDFVLYGFQKHWDDDFHIAKKQNKAK